MTFDVGADAYGQFMGRYSEPLATQFSRFAGVATGERVLDVGCGPGALTSVLATTLGPTSVTAVDPSEPFVDSVRQRLPEVDVRSASAESLPFADGTFDRTLAQLVVHFMADPVAGLTEMARVTCPAGVVAACVWDHAGGRSPLSAFWNAVTDLDPAARDESQLAGAREGHLASLFADAGLRNIETNVLTVTVDFSSFDQWWEPFTLGVGPAGAYVAALDPAARQRLRQRCAELVPATDFAVEASVWAAAGQA